MNFPKHAYEMCFTFVKNEGKRLIEYHCFGCAVAELD